MEQYGAEDVVSVGYFGTALSCGYFSWEECCDEMGSEDLYL